MYTEQNEGVHRYNARERFKEYALGKVVLTKYNNKHYRVDDVDWESTPESTFTQMRNGNPVQVSFIEYYRTNYNVIIRDSDQPMLVTRGKIKRQQHASNWVSDNKSKFTSTLVWHWKNICMYVFYLVSRVHQKIFFSFQSSVLSQVWRKKLRQISGLWKLWRIKRGFHRCRGITLCKRSSSRLIVSRPLILCCMRKCTGMWIRMLFLHSPAKSEVNFWKVGVETGRWNSQS